MYTRAQINSIIQAAVYTNTEEKITGDALQAVLLAMNNNYFNESDDKNAFVPITGTNTGFPVTGNIEFQGNKSLFSDDTIFKLSDSAFSSGIITDRSGNSNSGVMGGDVLPTLITSPSGTGKAISFDGNGSHTSYVNYGNKFALTSNGLTFDFDITVNNVSLGYGYFIVKGDINNPEYSMLQNNSVLSFGGGGNGVSTTSLTQGVTYHIRMIVHPASGVFASYVNGTRVGLNGGGVTIPTGGGDFILGSTNGQLFNGPLDNLRVFEYAAFDPNTTLSYPLDSTPYDLTGSPSLVCDFNEFGTKATINNYLSYLTDYNVLGSLDLVHSAYLNRAISTAGAGYQPLNATLTSLSNDNTNGGLYYTGSNTITSRTLTGTTNRLTITNGDGVSGNPTFDIASGYVGQNTITTLGTIGTGVWHGTAIEDAYLGTSYIKADGTRTLTGNWNAGSFVITADSFSATGTGANYIPVGTTGQRPSGVNGAIRYNSTTGRYEFGLTSGNTWKNFVRLDGDTLTGNLLFNTGLGIDADTAGGVLNVGGVNAGTVNLGVGSSNTAVNIGTAGTNIITIGNSLSTVNILGTVLYENVTNLTVTDKLITLNKGGSAGSATGAGIEFEENSLITGYIKTTGGRDGFLFRAPANSYDSSFLFAPTAARSYTLPDLSGTLATIDGGQTFTSAIWNGTVVTEQYGGTGQGSYTLGNILYASATNTLSKLAGNTTATRKFLGQTGTGTVSAAPIWDTILASDIPGSALTRTNDTNVTLTLGGSPTTALLNAASLTLGWTGILSIARGGTNSSTALSGSTIMVTDGTSIIQGSAGTTTTVLHGNASGLPTYGAVSLTADISGTLAAGNGGTGISAYTIGDLLYASATNTLSKLAGVATGNALISGGLTTAPAWGKIGLTTHITGTLAVINGGTALTTFGGINTILYTTAADALASITTGNNGVLITSNTGVPSISSTLPNATQDNITRLGTIASIGAALGATFGGTGFAGYAVGDILSANTTTTLSKIAGVATGNALISGGVNTLPSWGKIGLATHVSGTLGVANGGTGTTTAFTQGSVVFAGASGVYSQDNANFFWDATNFRLGILTATPSTTLSFGNAANRTIGIESSATDVIGRILLIQAGSTVAGTSVSDVNGGNLTMRPGLGTGAGTSSIVFQTGTTLTTGTTLQTYSTKMTILGSGFIGMGTGVPLTNCHVAHSDTAAVRGIMSAQYNNGTDGARIIHRKARGTDTSPIIIVTGDTLSNHITEGYDGSNYLQMASIKVVATGTIAATRVPTYMSFLTATDAAPSVLTEALRLTAAQLVQPMVGIFNDSGGFKHARVSTGSINGAATGLVTITWTTAFADTNYTVVAQVQDSTTSSLALSVVHIESKTAAAVTVRVLNNAVGALTGTVHVAAIHD